MAEDQRYRVTIGLSINKQGNTGFNDNGVTYHNMPYDMMVKVQDLFRKHAPEMLKGMDPLLDDLMAEGFDQAVIRTGNEAKPAREKR